MAHPSWWSAHAAALLRSQTFDFITGFVIIANSITIGIEQSLIMAKKESAAMSNPPRALIDVQYQGRWGRPGGFR